MKFFLISDTHFNHQNIATYCQRPSNFTEILIKNWNTRVKPEDTVIHLGDVAIGKKSEWIMPSLPGRKILVRGNHDESQSVSLWAERGLDFACDGLMFRNCWLTHKPASALPEGATLNIHGHLHNIWHGFHPNEGIAKGDDEKMRLRNALKNPWQLLFAVEYTNYCPIEFNEFVSKPHKYFARGIR